MKKNVDRFGNLLGVGKCLVLEPAVFLVARVIPIDILAFEQNRIFDGNGALCSNEAQESSMVTPLGGG